ncbi:hypothetical protein WJX82_003779 [Trebouxia sp. C0006]
MRSRLDSAAACAQKRQKMSCSDKKIAETDQLYTKLHDCYSRKVGNKPYVEDDRHVDGKDELAAELASSCQEWQSLEPSDSIVPKTAAWSETDGYVAKSRQILKDASEDKVDRKRLEFAAVAAMYWMALKAVVETGLVMKELGLSLLSYIATCTKRKERSVDLAVCDVQQHATHRAITGCFIEAGLSCRVDHTRTQLQSCQKPAAHAIFKEKVQQEIGIRPGDTFELVNMSVDVFISKESISDNATELSNWSHHAHDCREMDMLALSEDPKTGQLSEAGAKPFAFPRRCEKAAYNANCQLPFSDEPDFPENAQISAAASQHATAGKRQRTADEQPQHLEEPRGEPPAKVPKPKQTKAGRGSGQPKAGRGSRQTGRRSQKSKITSQTHSAEFIPRGCWAGSDMSY